MLRLPCYCPASKSSTFVAFAKRWRSTLDFHRAKKIRQPLERALIEQFLPIINPDLVSLYKETFGPGIYREVPNPPHPATPFLETKSSLLLKRGHAKTLIHNRPHKDNALTLEELSRTRDLLEIWENDSSSQAIVLQGSKQNYSAGYDLKEFYQHGIDYAKACVTTAYEISHMIKSYQKPLIPFFAGLSIGAPAGYGLSSGCCIGTDTTVFSRPEAAYGYIPDAGSCANFSVLGPMGKFLAMTGQRISGNDLYHLGYAGFVIPTEFEHLMYTSLCSMKNRDSLAPRLFMMLDSLSINPEEFSLSFYEEDIKEAFSKDTVEEIFEELLKQRTRFSKHIHDKMRKMSPLSLKVINRLFVELGRSTHADMFKYFHEKIAEEYNVALNMLEMPDFYEGIRCHIIEKGAVKPRWKHSCVEAVSDSDVDRIFEPRHPLPMGVRSQCRLPYYVELHRWRHAQEGKVLLPEETKDILESEDILDHDERMKNHVLETLWASDVPATLDDVEELLETFEDQPDITMEGYGKEFGDEILFTPPPSPDGKYSVAELVLKMNTPYYNMADGWSFTPPMLTPKQQEASFFKPLIDERYPDYDDETEADDQDSHATDQKKGGDDDEYDEFLEDFDEDEDEQLEEAA